MLRVAAAAPPPAPTGCVSAAPPRPQCSEGRASGGCTVNDHILAWQDAGVFLDLGHSCARVILIVIVAVTVFTVGY